MINIKQNKNVQVNQSIRANEVFVIGPNGEKLGIKTKKDAITLAEYAGFDLVMIGATATPPVCKIMDYNKHKYESQKKQKEASRKQRENNTEMKEYRLSCNIDVHDFDTKLRNARKYLEKNHRVKLSIRFRGREIIHNSRGSEVLLRFAKQLEDVADVEKKPLLDGRSMFMFLSPKSK